MEHGQAVATINSTLYGNAGAWTLPGGTPGRFIEVIDQLAPQMRLDTPIHGIDVVYVDPRNLMPLVRHKEITRRKCKRAHKRWKHEQWRRAKQ